MYNVLTQLLHLDSVSDPLFSSKTSTLIVTMLIPVIFNVIFKSNVASV